MKSLYSMQLNSVRNASIIERSQERDLLLQVFEASWSIALDESLPLGSLCGASFSNGWAWICSSRDDFRWIKIIRDSRLDQGIRMSSATLWNYFGMRIDVGAGSRSMINILIKFALLPDYIPSTILPVRKIDMISIGLVWDLAVCDLLHDKHLASKIIKSLRVSGVQACMIEGDTWWIPIRYHEIDIPVPIAIRGLPYEAFVDFQAVHVNVDLSPNYQSIAPIPIDEDSKLGSHLRAFVEDKSGSLVKLYGLTGDIYKIQEVLGGICRYLSIPLHEFPVDGKLPTSNSDDTPSCWILKIKRSSEHVVELLKRILRRNSIAPVYVFVLVAGGVVDANLERLFTKQYTWTATDAEYGVNKADSSLLTGLDWELVDSALVLRQLENADLADTIKKIKQRLGRKGETEVPKVHWGDVAGLEKAKKLLIETISQNNGKFPQLGRRCGLLLYGPPGTGKTLLAKAAATEFNLSFISVKGPELLDIYVGESEAHIRDLFKEAKRCRPCIIFFDEIDSIGVIRGKDGDSGGVADRLVSQLLLEIDSLTYDEDAQNVFLIGATNRPDLLDPALLRPGRFDKLIRLGCPETIEEQAEILRISSRNYLLSLDVDFYQIAQKLEKNLSPADLASICHNAMKFSMAKVIRRSTQANNTVPPDYAVTICLDDFWAAASIVK